MCSDVAIRTRTIVDDKSGEKQEWIVMENAIKGLAKPAIADVKIGTRTYGVEASPAKIDEQTQKAMESTQGSIGARVIGAHMLNESGDDFIQAGYKYSKDEPKTLQDFSDLLLRFLSTDSLRQEAERYFLELYDWFSSQTEFEFYGSSLLLSFDTQDGGRQGLVCKLIDFGNVVKRAVVSQSAL